jgi:hypothetical protein
MTRSNNDRWDLSTSVGATATMVAAARAVASRRANPLVNDPFAELLVKAAGIELFARLARGDLDFDDLGPSWMADFFGVRARFFDAFFPAAPSTGIHQAVIVGSGLDSRAYRLDWPDTIVYEIDKPEVIEFKNSTRTVQPAMATQQVGADTRHVGVGLAAVVPVRHVAVATAENACGVEGTGYRFPSAVDAAGVGHRDDRPKQRFAWYAGPVGAFAADEFAFYHREAQPGGAGTSGDILADRSGADDNHVV